jgi:ferrous iron transport protein A
MIYLVEIGIMITNSIMTLAQLPAGETARVAAFTDENAVSRRLMEMGVIPGVSVQMVKSAPFGCPIEIRVRGYSLALRRSEAQSIELIPEV